MTAHFDRTDNINTSIQKQTDWWSKHVRNKKI